jgi:hypothetical protein
LIANVDETVNTGLICLQKDYSNAVESQNVAYLTLLVTAFKNVSDESIQEVSVVVVNDDCLVS